MANAWMIKPLPIVGTPIVDGTLQLGAPEYAFNDYAGTVCQIGMTDSGGVNGSIKFDLGADTVFDTILVFGVELVPGGASLAVHVASAANGYFTGAYDQYSGAVYAGSVMPISGKGISIWSLPTTMAGRYIRLVYGGAGAGKSVRIARIVVGRRIQLERNFSFGAAFGVRDLGSLDFNRRGVMSRIRGKKLRTLGLTFSNVYKDEVEATTKPLLEQIGNTEMIAVLTDPDAHAQRQNRGYFGPLVGDLGHVWRTAKGWEVKVNQVSIF